MNTEPGTSKSADSAIEPITDGEFIKIKISVDFGRRRDSCLRFGFCRIEATFEIDQLKPATKGATGNGWIENGKLFIEFNRASMTDAAYATYFPNGRFLVEEDVELPADVAAALGVRAYTIKTGTYLSAANTENGVVKVMF